MKIGYQGEEFSYNYLAANKYLTRQGIKSNYELVPLRRSNTVVAQLKMAEIDIGIVAIQNSIAGIVKESYDALKTESFEHLDTFLIKVEHCLFIKKAGQKISKIASHEMALKQCQNFIQTNLPEVEQIEIEDTALGAKDLNEGRLKDDVAVICSREAGISHGLILYDSNIQDVHDNYTEFRVFKVRKPHEKLSFFQKVLLLFYSDDKPEFIFKLTITGVLIVIFILYDQISNDMSKIDAAWLYSGFLTSIYIFATNQKIRLKFYHGFLKGYWVYYAFSDENLSDQDQKFMIPRIVKVDSENGKLNLEMYRADQSGNVFAKSLDVISTKLGLKKGKLVYWYSKANNKTSNIDLGGIAYLSWENNSKWEIISNLKGRYLGDKTKDFGYLEFHRISKEEFKAICLGEYLETLSTLKANSS